MNTVTWELQYLNTPKTTRYCKKCGSKTQYASTEAFRINARQKSLDIWLIYKCIHCNTTWNLEICSRVDVKSIGNELLEKFTSNDRELALQYAMDTELQNRKGAVTEPPAFTVIGENVDFSQETAVRIISPFSLGIRISKILREKLMLSKKVFDEMTEAVLIRMADGGDITKGRLKKEALVIIGTADCVVSAE